MRLNLFFPLFLLFSIPLLGQHHPLVVQDSLAQAAWVQTRYNGMDLEERVGQLFMVSIASNQDKASTDHIRSLVRDEHIGGVIFLSGSTLKQDRVTNVYQ